MPTLAASDDLIRSRESEMIGLLRDWASINSGSDHEAGLARMLEALCEGFSVLPGELEIVPCTGGTNGAGGPEGFPRKALRIRREGADGGRPVLLNGHYDTVYGEAHPFQEVEALDGRRLRGPGVADMKGGLVVLLYALKLWEEGPHGGSLSWEVLLTPDEETGSAASIPLLRESAARCGLGLVYESADVAGRFVRRRMGSAVYTLDAWGRAAHVGRNFEEGRNALLALAGLCREVADIGAEEKLIVNLGALSGGGPLNVVPGFARSRWNVRSFEEKDFATFEAAVRRLLERVGGRLPAGIAFEFSGGPSRPPKPDDESARGLRAALESVAAGLLPPVEWRDTGGGSDGSNLAVYGLPNLDNLGVRGGGLHSEAEFVELDSLVERVRLSLAILDAVRRREFFPYV